MSGCGSVPLPPPVIPPLTPTVSGPTNQGRAAVPTPPAIVAVPPPLSPQAVAAARRKPKKGGGAGIVFALAVISGVAYFSTKWETRRPAPAPLQRMPNWADFDASQARFRQSLSEQQAKMREMVEQANQHIHGAVQNVNEQAQRISRQAGQVGLTLPDGFNLPGGPPVTPPAPPLGSGPTFVKPWSSGVETGTRSGNAYSETRRTTTTSGGNR